ncbi:MAG: BON domain-containing protein [Streptosporangiaceae bacterium]|nr:BON domain-containing protein [Streptosporangiaceae bacterium]MBV9854123.1 BON domain-containing protein [Streptosporangiaceae bacterium]
MTSREPGKHTGAQPAAGQPLEDQPPDYIAAQVERALARDPRTHELGVRAEVADGVVILRGQVAGEERRQLIGEVARDAVPGLAARNEVSVTEVLPPEPQEEHL